MSTLVLNPSATRSDFATAKIDEREGIVYGLSVITSGVEALGHGVRIDDKTLSTCLEAAKSWKDGVIAKADHGSGILEALGVFRNFRIDCSQLRADLHLLKSQPRTASVIELARKAPQSCGFSISFNWSPEEINDETYVRVTKLWSIDLVSNPAANPTGMFSSGARNNFLKLTAAFCAAEGRDGARRIEDLPRERQVDLMERALFFWSISVPGYDFSHVRAKWGEPPACFGLRRIEASARQALVNQALSRLA